MKIVVLVKEVPDTYGDRKLDLETGLAKRGATEAVPDEIGDRALEVALSYADAHTGAEVMLLSMGPKSVVNTLRKGLAMGAGSATHVLDDGLVGADIGLTAEVLAAALKRIGFDLVIAGNRSTDGAGGVVPSMIAEFLDVPHATNLESIDITESDLRGVRRTDGGTMDVVAALPAIASISESLPDARFPNFKGIMAAKKKSIETLALADLAIDENSADRARSIVIAITEKPARIAGIKIIDEGDAGEKLAEFLVQSRLA